MASAASLPGGYRQKARWAEQQREKDKEQEQSHLAQLLVTNWCWKELSTPLVQQIAHSACLDGAKSADLQKLADLGSKGLYPGNMYQEMIRLLKEMKVNNAMSKIKVWMKKQPYSMVHAEHSCLWPHALFSTLYHDYPDKFKECLCGGDFGNLEKFWTDMNNHPGYLMHPLRDREHHQTRAIPLAIHADGIPVQGLGKSWSKSVDAYSWGSCLAKGSTMASLFLIYLIYWKHLLQNVGKNAFEQFSHMLHWSMYWLFLGVHPKRDPSGKAYSEYPDGHPDKEKAGTPLAGGFFGVLWLLLGDLEEMAKAWLLNHSASVCPCALCRCNKSTIPWTDGRDGALWRHTIWNPVSWLAAHPNRHILFTLPGVTALCFIPDILHVLHLGCYQYIFGSVLMFLTHHVMEGTPENNLRQVWNLIHSFQKDCAVNE